MKIVPRSIEHIPSACLASATWTYVIDDLYLYMRPVEDMSRKHMILLCICTVGTVDGRGYMSIKSAPFVMLVGHAT